MCWIQWEERKKKYCTWGRTCPWEEGPLPGTCRVLVCCRAWPRSKPTIQSHPLIFLFLVREILIWLLPDKNCVETSHKDMCPEVQLLNTSMHLWEEIKIPKNKKTKFLWVLEEVMRKTYCALKVFQNLLTKLINYSHGFWCNLYCITVLLWELHRVWRWLPGKPQLLIKRQIQVKLCNVHIKNIKTSFKLISYYQIKKISINVKYTKELFL